MLARLRLRAPRVYERLMQQLQHNPAGAGLSLGAWSRARDPAA